MELYNFKRSTILLIVFTGLVLINIFAIKDSSQLKEFIPFLFSSISIMISLTFFFKNEIFPLQLKAKTGDILLFLHRGSASAEDFILILSFLNIGYVDTEIENIFIRVIDPDGIGRIYDSQVEVDKLLFDEIRKNKNERKGEENNLFSFPISARSSVQKFISFHYEDKSNTLLWVTGKYQFEVFIKIWQLEKLQKIAQFEHHITEQLIAILHQQSAYLIRARLSSKLDRQIYQLKSK